MPTPKKDEKKQDFINRCIPYIIENEGKKPDQASAMCYSLWEESKKSKEQTGTKKVTRKWSKSEAIKWLKAHDFKSSNYEKMTNYHSFRQQDPSKYQSFRIDKSPFNFKESDGVLVVYGIYKKKGKKVSEIQSIRFYHSTIIKSIYVKILSHTIDKSEPTILLNDILINGAISKKVNTQNILLTHSHQVNIETLRKLQKGKIYLLEEHEHFLKQHIDKADEKFELNYIELYKTIKIDDLEIYPILTKHTVQEIYGENCLGYIINKEIAILTPCHSITKKSLVVLDKIKILIIDGGYRIKELYKDHKSILNTLKEFKDYKNLQHIYFLGTHKDYKITGKIKNTNIKVDTLFKGDILKIKINTIL